MNIAETIRDLFHQPFFVGLLAMLTCLCFYILKGENTAYKKMAWAVYYMLFGVTFFLFLATTVYRITHPQIWDFTCFYLWGKVAAGGHNFYQPEHLQAVYHSIQLPPITYEGFEEEIVNVGFFYPPPTILYFVPLGYLSYDAAIISWTAFILLFAAGSVYLIYDLFLKQYKWKGFLLVATLFCVFLPSLSTVKFSQTNFILLFYLLLMLKLQDTKIAGLLLALSFFTKPFMLIFIVYFILRKNWGAILYFMISAAALMGITLLLFGEGPFISYIFDNPVSRMPKSLFTESINQSLNAVLLRSGLTTLEKPILYLGIVGGILVVAGLYILYLLKRKLYDHIWAMLLLVGLLIYAGTLSYYAVLMLFIVFQFFDEKRQLGFNKYWNIPIFGVFYYLTTVSVFSSICFMIIILLIRAFWPGMPQNIILPEDEVEYNET